MTHEERLEVACDRTMKAVDSMKGRVVEHEAELARVREERDRLMTELRRSADRFRSFAAHCREFGWPNLGGEFDGFARDCEAALAAGGEEGKQP